MDRFAPKCSLDAKTEARVATRVRFDANSPRNDVRRSIARAAVIGIDGAEWKGIDVLIAEGGMSISPDRAAR